MSLLCNRFGVIAPTVLWPDIGIGLPEKGGRFAFKTFEEAFSAMDGKSFVLEVRDRYRTLRINRELSARDALRLRRRCLKNGCIPLRNPVFCSGDC